MHGYFVKSSIKFHNLTLTTVWGQKLLLWQGKYQKLPHMYTFMLQNGDITFENLTVMKIFESIWLEIVCV